MKKLLLISLLFPVLLSAQVNLDSLWGVWSDKTQPDTSRLKAMQEISRDGYLFTQPDSAFYFAQKQYDFAKAKKNKINMVLALNTQGISLALRSQYTQAIDYFNKGLKIQKKIGDKKGVASSLNNIANIYSNQGDYTQAIDYYTKSLKISEEIEDEKGVEACLNNIANIYQEQGNYAQAIDHYTKSLKIGNKIGDKKGIAMSLNNIGLIYKKQGNHEQAIDYFTKSLKMQENIGDKHGVTQSWSNIGLIYQSQGNYDQAIDYYTKSLKTRKKIGYKKGVAVSLNNIGSIYLEQDSLSQAIDYYTKSLKIRKEIGDQKGIAGSLNNIGNIYNKQNNHTKAIDFSSRSLKIAQKIGIALETKNAARSLWKSYKQTGRFKKSLKMHELYIQTKDSIESAENQKEVIRQRYKYKYEKQALADSIQNVKENKVKDAKLAAEKAENKQRQQRAYLLYGGLALALLFGGFIFNRFWVTSKQKGVIEEQKEQMDVAYDQLEEKNGEIMDSINYAQRIQSSILPPGNVVKQHFPESFILYKPKDVVAGDFYWLEPKNGKILFAAADCTGHGVPGAMVSVVCNNALNRSVREHNLTDPAAILDQTRDIVIDEFGKSKDNVKDGMDIALCALHTHPHTQTQTQTHPHTHTVLEYAGANNPLWIIRKGANEIEETKANKQPIGQYDDPVPYTSNSVQLNPGDSVYIFSDGYVDQFGGEKSKKFKPKALKELLLSIQDKNMKEQKALIDENFESWRGDQEQVDDICMFGVKV